MSRHKRKRFTWQINLKAKYRIWFREFKLQFHLSKITASTTKFHHAPTLLLKDIAFDVITEDFTKYKDLKQSAACDKTFKGQLPRIYKTSTEFNGLR